MEEELQYIVTFDSDGNPMEGGKSYKFHIPPDVPAKKFWSVIVYDKQTRLMIHTDQRWPSVFSNCQTLVTDKDGSVDIYFGPKAPPGNNCNWIKTIPRYGWNIILRLYGPMESWFDKTWRPGEIELVK